MELSRRLTTFGSAASQLLYTLQSNIHPFGATGEPDFDVQSITSELNIPSMSVLICADPKTPVEANTKAMDTAGEVNYSMEEGTNTFQVYK